MTEKQEKTTLPFTYYCNAKEEGNCPLIPQLIEQWKSLEKSQEKGMILTISLAATNGKRLLLSKEIRNNEPLNREDFCEIIDIDPVKQTILYFGLIQPPEITPYLYMIHHAKKEIQFSIHITLKNTNKTQIIHQCKPDIDKQQDFIENIKKIMRQLQNTDELFITKNELIITANSIQKIKEKIKTFQERIQ